MSNDGILPSASAMSDHLVIAAPQKDSTLDILKSIALNIQCIKNNQKIADRRFDEWETKVAANVKQLSVRIEQSAVKRPHDIVHLQAQIDNRAASKVKDGKEHTVALPSLFSENIADSVPVELEWPDGSESWFIHKMLPQRIRFLSCQSEIVSSSLHSNVSTSQSLDFSTIAVFLPALAPTESDKIVMRSVAPLFFNPVPPHYFSRPFARLIGFQRTCLSSFASWYKQHRLISRGRQAIREVLSIFIDHCSLLSLLPDLDLHHVVYDWDWFRALMVP